MRVLYTDPAWAIGPDGRPDPALASIESEVLPAGTEIRIGPHRNGRYANTGTALLRLADGADAIVVYRCQVTPDLVTAAGPRCRVIARQGVGLDNLNIPLLRERDLYGFHVPDYCGEEVSTHAIALLLALERGVCEQDALVKADQWNIYGGGVPRRTSGLTAGIIGFGRIGRAVSRKLSPFYHQVLGYDPYVPADLMASHGVTKREELHRLLADSDAVLLHAGLTAETTRIIGRETARQLRPGSVLVNAARGGLVDPEAVIAALDSGLLRGFASDVFSPEDPNRDPVTRELLKRDNVIVTSHRAFLSAESEASLRRRIAEGIAQVLSTGGPPPYGRVA
jgi:D-3-phosphoglycerate dehydrogenase